MNDVKIVLIAAASSSSYRLRDILESEDTISCVHLVDSGHEGLARVERVRPDLVLIDSDLPGLSGVSIAAIVKRDFPDSVVVLLTRYVDYDCLLASSLCGASTAICRDADPVTIMRTLLGVLDRQAKLYPWGMFEEELDRSNYGGGRKRDRIDHVMSARAAAVLDCLVMGLNLDEMKHALQTTRYGVRKSINAVVATLESDGRIPAIVTAIERGWCSLQPGTLEITVISPAYPPGERDIGQEFSRRQAYLFPVQRQQGYVLYG